MTVQYGSERSKGLVILKVVVAMVIAWFIIHTVVITIDGLRDENAPCDVAVVPGNEVLPGNKPSARLAARLDAAARLYLSRSCGTIIVSGGIDPAGTDEAKVMKDYLIAKGVSADSILTDNKGVNTRATAVNTGRIMKEHGLNSVVIVTQFFHITRMKQAFRQCGIDHVYSVHADFFELRDVYASVREFFAFCSYLVRY